LLVFGQKCDGQRWICNWIWGYEYGMIAVKWDWSIHRDPDTRLNTVVFLGRNNRARKWQTRTGYKWYQLQLSTFLDFLSDNHEIFVWFLTIFCVFVLKFCDRCKIFNTSTQKYLESYSDFWVCLRVSGIFNSRKFQSFKFWVWGHLENSKTHEMIPITAS
jgi:hypothetical protein